MRFPIIAAIVAATLLAVSGNAQQPDPKKLKDQLTGDVKGAASANPQCKLFTQAEISAHAGAPLGPGQNAAGGTGCMWSDKDGESSAIVQGPSGNCQAGTAADYRRPEGGDGFVPPAISIA